MLAIETLLDGNRTSEMVEWCFGNLTDGRYQEIEQVLDERYPAVPRLLRWRWIFSSQADLDQFAKTWPCRYQVAVPLWTSGNGRCSAMDEQPDEWQAWAKDQEMAFETLKVESRPPYLYTMGEPIGGKFSVRYLRFAREEDAVWFRMVWG